MTRQDPRARDPISRSELERRWALTRDIMAEARVDAIVVRGSSNGFGINGYHRWLTGAVAIGSYPVTAIFPLTGEMTVIAHGAYGDIEIDPANAEYPGAGRRMTSPSFPMIGYTGEIDGALAAQDLKKRGVARIALLGSFGMGHDFVARMLTDLGSVTTVSITDAIDRVKAIKSAEEIVLIRRAAAMQDALMARAAAFIRPGMRQFEVTAELARESSLAGSETGFILGAAGQPGDPGPPMFPLHVHMQGKTLRDNDIVLVLAENSGPGGMVTHINRLFVLGKTPAEIEDRHAAALEAQDYTLAMLVPGASFADVFRRYNEYMVAHGFAPEERLHAHGQGYDIVERPLVRDDETMEVAVDMNIGIHPAIMHRGVMVMSTDNYLIGADSSPRLHQTERRIFEIG